MSRVDDEDDHNGSLRLSEPPLTKYAVVIPTYNEAANLPIKAAELWALRIPELEILVVDDNSPDGTGEVAEELADLYPGKFFVIRQPKRLGLREACITGFEWSLRNGAGLIFQMDCDFSHATEHIPEMLNEIKRADVVVGSRFVAGGKLDEQWGVGRYLLSWWANNVYARLILNLKVKDATTGYKCWRAAALQGIDLDTIASDGYSFQIEMAYVAQQLGYQVVEIPINFEDRRIGRSRHSLSTKLRAAMETWEILFRYRNRPVNKQRIAALPNEEK